MHLLKGTGSSTGFGMVAPKQLTTQQVAIILQEGEMKVAEELNMFVFHF